jgi:preprotein translocase subunit SecA
MFNSERVGAIMERLSIPPDVPVESKVVTRAIRSAQTQVEQQNFEIRKDVLKYDDVLNRQRQVIYGERRQVLEGADLHEQIREMVDEVSAGYVAGETADGYPEEWDLDKLWRAFRQLYPMTLTVDEVIDEAGGERAGLTAEFLTEAITADAQAAYERREQEFGSEVMREVERRVVLSVLDRKWREHLYEMDYLREGIGLRGYGQRDPLIEYQREGYDMFSAMMEGIKEESVGNLFNLVVQVQENPIVEEGGATAAVGGVQAAVAPVGAPEATGPAGPPSPTGRHGVPAQATGQPPARAGAPASGAAPAAGAARAPGAAPASGGTPARGGAARASGAAPARGGAAPAPAGAAAARSGQGGTAAKRDGRVSGAQSGTAAKGRTGGAHARPAGAPAAPVVPAGLAPRRPQRLQYSAPSVDGGTHVETSQGPGSDDEFARVGRNDPCPCGSGRKFKRCHGDPRMRPDA